MQIDVMMPFYGDPEKFKTAVESVLGQSSDSWHLTVIDDCYPDVGPGEWVESLNHPRVTYVRNSANLGVSGNFSKALELASADYVVIMGCDDRMGETYVERMMELIKEFPDASYIQPGVTIVNEAGRAVTPLPDLVKAALRPKGAEPRSHSGEILAASLLRGNWTYFPSICWNRSSAAPFGFEPTLEITLDLALQLQIIFGGGSLVTDNQKTFFYRRHASSVSSWTAADGSRFAEELRLFQWAQFLAAKKGWQKAVNAARHHLSSRLNAVTQLPRAVRVRDGKGIRLLTKHAFSAGDLPAGRETLDSRRA